MTGEETDRFNEITSFRMALFCQKAIEFFYRLYTSFSLTQNTYLTWNFTAHLFYRSLSDWVEYGLLGHRSMRS